MISPHRIYGYGAHFGIFPPQVRNCILIFITWVSTTRMHFSMTVRAQKKDIPSLSGFLKTVVNGGMMWKEGTNSVRWTVGAYRPGALLWLPPIVLHP